MGFAFTSREVRPVRLDYTALGDGPGNSVQHWWLTKPSAPDLVGFWRTAMLNPGGGLTSRLHFHADGTARCIRESRRSRPKCSLARGSGRTGKCRRLLSFDSVQACQTLPISCVSYAPTAGNVGPTKASPSNSQIAGRKEDRLKSATRNKQKQNTANHLCFGC